MMTEPTDGFDSTVEFQRFKNVMRKLIAVPKAELDALVQAAKEASPRKGDPHAPGRKRTKVSRSGHK